MIHLMKMFLETCISKRTPEMIYFIPFVIKLDSSNLYTYANAFICLNLVKHITFATKSEPDCNC